MINYALDCINNHTDGRFITLDKQCLNCQSRNICHEVILSLGSYKLVELMQQNKVEIERQHMVTNN